MLRHHSRVRFTLVASLMYVAGSAGAGDPKRDALWAAVRAADVKAVAVALDGGANVNATNEIGVSALWNEPGRPGRRTPCGGHGQTGETEASPELGRRQAPTDRVGGRSPSVGGGRQYV
jgi:hypothetical protein